MTSDEIEIEIADADHPVMVVRITTPSGTIELIGEVGLRDRMLIIDKAHVQGLAPGALGRAGLNAIGRTLLMEPTSLRSSFREVIAGRASAGAASPRPSAPRTRLLLEAATEIRRPIDIVRHLRTGGLPLRRAHAVLERVAEGRTAVVEIATDDLAGLTARLASLGVEATPLLSARAVPGS